MKKNYKTIPTPCGNMDLKVYSYLDNTRLAIILYLKNGEIYGDLTVNLSDLYITDIDEGFINSNMNVQGDGEKIINTLKKLGIIEKSYGFKKYNLGSYEYVKFNLDKLSEYDPDGVKEFKNYVDGLLICNPSFDIKY